ncbi:hypothetical protein CAPTEDRAFT_113410 [Capitella teleta]|uniref:RING-type domain-containing protein n=1 Tax=Capitella teleta TaxID=283909 RepID=R7TQY2_CAPTE|nr:hypothetical protein CAPTEDRAFT_113410 [Capitella teleta]|eukprot:ELT95987.1 hypothetical protein CAPTEDRAFT_113410 [Capitella teleta]
MGFDQDRFLVSVNDGLLCCICRDVLEDPVQGGCEHAYCSPCIHGWLVQQSCCPEDRRDLHETSLRPLSRYMKNDLDSLQIRCKNASAGCQVTCRLEHVTAHEAGCQYDAVECPLMGCSQTMERRSLDEHLTRCQFRRLCPSGCGMPMLSADDIQHSCIAELRQTNDLLRSEMICKLEEQKQDFLSKIVEMNQQHRQEIVALRTTMVELKEVVDVMVSRDRKRSEEIKKIGADKRELTNMLRNFLKQHVLREDTDRPSTSKSKQTSSVV